MFLKACKSCRIFLCHSWLLSQFLKVIFCKKKKKSRKLQQCTKKFIVNNEPEGITRFWLAKKSALTSHMLDFKVVTRVQITNRAFEISSMLTFCDVFSCTLLTSNNMFSLAIWRQWTLVIILKTTRARAIFLYLKNLLLFINTKLHWKSCYHLY